MRSYRRFTLRLAPSQPQIVMTVHVPVGLIA